MTAQNSDSISWWVVLLPTIFPSLAMIVTFLIITRKRRWRDRALLAKATTMPPEHIAQEPRTVRDLEIGEEAYVRSSAIVTSKKGRRVFVEWDASLADKPQDPDNAWAPLQIRRLARGFPLTVRPGDEFRTSTVPWGWYAPVTEILQAVPSGISQTK